MPPLTTQNIESELSYAYLHAVAASIGATLSDVNRHLDNAGIDAKLTAWGPFPEGGYLTELDLNIQLKATVKQPLLKSGRLSYELAGIHRYDALRAETLATPRILVVLFLPDTQEQWLELTDDHLKLRKCAHWVSLRGAPETSNKSSVTVYLPEVQKFHPQSLTQLLAKLSRQEALVYEEVPDASDTSD